VSTRKVNAGMHINDMILLMYMADFYQKCIEVVLDQLTRKDVCYLFRKVFSKE